MGMLTGTKLVPGSAGPPTLTICVKSNIRKSLDSHISLLGTLPKDLWRDNITRIFIVLLVVLENNENKIWK